MKKKTTSKHIHIPVHLSECSKAIPGTNPPRFMFGVSAICYECGEIRHLWPNGEVEIPGKNGGLIKTQ
jgi:hypothetical protein